MGIDASTGSKTPSGPYGRIYHPSIGASSSRGHRGGTGGSGIGGSVSYSTRGKTASSSRNDRSHDGDDFGQITEREFTDERAAAHQKGPLRNSDPTATGRPFNAWGPQGQVATHYKTLTASTSSVQSNTSNRPGTYATATRRMGSALDQHGKWPRIKPSNNPAAAGRSDKFQSASSKQ